MKTDILSNRFIVSRESIEHRFESRAFAETSGFIVVQNGVMMDPFYRKSEESPHPNRGRKRHLGVDITGPVAGDGSINDPRRGLPVYAAIKTKLSLSEMNAVGVYNKSDKTSSDGLSLPGIGDADMVEAKIALQPWSSSDNDSYGGIVGMSCIYSYNNNSGGTSEFTLYVEFLHLINEKYLPKDRSGTIATSAEWSDTGRGIGFGPSLQNGSLVTPGFFIGPGFPLIGYLGATETPHVHIQVSFFNKRTYDKNATIRIDPMIVVF